MSTERHVIQGLSRLILRVQETFLLHTRYKKNYQLIARSGLFDRAWYLDQHRNLRESGLDPIIHYLRHSRKSASNPHPLFHHEWYLTHYPEVLGTRINPLVHYLSHGAAEGKDPNPLFDTDWYIERNPDVARTGQNALAHYLSCGSADGCDPSPFFDTHHYLAQNPDIAKQNINPLTHYFEHGWKSPVLPHDSVRLLRGIKIAVIAHLFYADLWNEIDSALSNIPVDFDLFVTVPRERAHALRGLVLRSRPTAQVIEVPNVGRDIGPFLAVLPTLLSKNYTVFCKLHTKKGPTEAHIWRYLLMRGVLGNKMLVTRILHAFQSDPELVMVGPGPVYVSGPMQMTVNKKKLESLAQALYPNKGLPAKWGFFAGTMFWARPKLFDQLIASKAEIFSFEKDNRRNDGQLAHALERIFGAIASIKGKRIGLTSISSLSPLDGTVHVTLAPGPAYEGNFVLLLRREAAKLQGVIPEYSQRARWIIRQALMDARIFAERYRALRPILSITLYFRRLRARRVYCKLIASSKLFDPNWYLESFPEVRSSGLDPARHYFERGAAKGLNPSALFDTSWYLSEYPDVAAIGLNPLVHYLQRGVEEGRLPLPPAMDSDIYDTEENDYYLPQSRKGVSGEAFEGLPAKRVAAGSIVGN